MSRPLLERPVGPRFEWGEVLDLLASAPARIAAATSDASSDDLLAPLEPGGWSARDVLGHIRACDRTWGGYVARILDQDHPSFRAESPRSTIRRTDFLTQPFRASLEAWLAASMRYQAWRSRMHPFPSSCTGSPEPPTLDGRVRTKSNRGFRRRLAPVVLVAAIVALAVAPVVSAEQASSKALRVPAASVTAGGDHTCVILDTGGVRCWGDASGGRLGYGNLTDIGDTETPGSVGPVDLGTGRTAVAISAGADHTCAILDTGAVRCWGSGDQGQLGYGNSDGVGDNETPGSAGPVDIGTGRKAVAITAGGDHTCVILDTGGVRCWGDASGGRLGYGNLTDIGDTETPGSVGPVDLGTGRTAVAISAGADHTCAILDTGAVRCWGSGDQGQLGYGNSDGVGDNETPGSAGPVDIGTGRKAVAITAGGDHTCVILDTGGVRCWGDASGGRLGYGNLTDIGDTETPGSVGPVDLGTGRTAVAISAGADHTCAILDTGAVRCWGSGDQGQLGYGNSDGVGDNETPGSAGPVDIGTGRKAVAITAGGDHTCVILDTGGVRCWGDASGGRLGYGNLTDIGDTETPGSVGPVSMGGLATLRGMPSVTLTLAPRRDRSSPYKMKASGKITGFFIDAATCKGKVLVQASKGKKSVSERTNAKFTSGVCRYSVTLTVKGVGKWKVRAAFAGNPDLNGRSSPAGSFRAG